MPPTQQYANKVTDQLCNDYRCYADAVALCSQLYNRNRSILSNLQLRLDLPQHEPSSRLESNT
jgi:hypothetical protein